jgi:hypothetical protein
MELGADVEVHSRFDDTWIRGFEVAEIEQRDRSFALRLRRRSDGAVLPVLFDSKDVREAKPRDRTWP